MSFIHTVVYFIIALGILIFVHELGHFLVAKRNKICVEVFSLGFGKRLIGFKWGETDYRLSMLPFGGYVKMLGEEDFEKGEKPDPRGFGAQSIWVRVKVIVFGPAMNFIFCVICMPIVFMIGISRPAYLQESPVVVGVKDGSPAQTAGFAVGDKVIAVDGKEVGKWEELISNILIAPDKELTLKIDRKGIISDKIVKVGSFEESQGGYIGIEPKYFIGYSAIVDAVEAGGPADIAGVTAGDLVIEFGKEPVADWVDMWGKVNAGGGKPAKIAVMRDEKKMEFTVTPLFNEKVGRWVLGISHDPMKYIPMSKVKFGFWDAITNAMVEVYRLTTMTFDVLWRLVSGQLSYKVLGGPGMIAKTAASAAASGLSDFIYFLAFLSLQLSILNFLPIPVLDGGQLVFLTAEAIKRKPISVRVREIANTVGMVMLISLMLFVTLNDFGGFRGLAKKAVSAGQGVSAIYHSIVK